MWRPTRVMVMVCLEIVSGSFPKLLLFSDSYQQVRVSCLDIPGVALLGACFSP